MFFTFVEDRRQNTEDRRQMSKKLMLVDSCWLIAIINIENGHNIIGRCGRVELEFIVRGRLVKRERGREAREDGWTREGNSSLVARGPSLDFGF
jgi:hypothetical protein